MSTLARTRLVGVPWWRRVLAHMRRFGRPTIGNVVYGARIKIPEFAGGGHVDIPPDIPSRQLPAAIPIAGPGVKISR